MKMADLSRISTDNSIASNFVKKVEHFFLTKALQNFSHISCILDYYSATNG